MIIIIILFTHNVFVDWIIMTTTVASSMYCIIL